ncbi:MAG TPA: dihydropteroate synthase, partial [Cryomorphaceae bacterium]|nr:dihydropteroate synthase [Cryomorphaceae bacterium]
MDTPNLPQKGAAKDTIFRRKHSLKIGGALRVIDHPWVMGILNTTHDSFYAKSRALQEENIRERIVQMLEEGADIIDVGAASTRPGAELSEPKTEMERLKPALRILSREFPDTPVSVDTYWSEVARMAVDAGAHIINDVSGGTIDDRMFSAAADLRVPYILMHIQGTPQTMQQDPRYKDVFREVAYYFSEKMQALLELGINDIILDPGFGFGK